MHCKIESFPFYGSRYSESTLSEVGNLVFAFVASLAVGYAIRATKGTQCILLNDNELDATAIGNRTNVAMAIAALCSIVCFALAGPDAILSSRGEVLADYQASPSELIVVVATRVCGFLSFVYAICASRITKHTYSRLLVFLTFGLFGLTNLPTVIPRFQLGAYLLTLFLIFGFQTTSKRLLIVFGLLFSQLTLFPFLSELARGDTENMKDLAAIEYISTHGDFDGFQSTVNVYLMTEANGYTHGGQLLSAIFFFVPRSLWPSKSKGTGGDAADFMGYSFNNLSAPLPAELFVDFGPIGLVLLASICGNLCAAVDASFSQPQSKLTAQRLLSNALICGYSFILMRGALVGVLGPVAFSVALAFAFSRYIQRSNE